MFEDPESQVSEFHVALARTNDTSSLITEWLSFGQPVGTVLHAEIDLRAVESSISRFVHGQSYFALVRSTNRVGLWSVSVSAGVEIDATPPQCIVLDGVIPGVDNDALTEDKLGIQWSCEDTESGISSLQYGVGSKRGDTDILPLRAHDSSRAIFLSDDVVVVPGSRYFILVVATNGAGQAVAVASDGAINDPTPPVVVEITNGGPFVFGTPSSYVTLAIRLVLRLSWQLSDTCLLLTLTQTQILGHLAFCGSGVRSDAVHGPIA